MALAAAVVFDAAARAQAQRGSVLRDRARAAVVLKRKHGTLVRSDGKGEGEGQQAQNYLRGKDATSISKQRAQVSKA
jgi:hypothetical protein